MTVYPKTVAAAVAGTKSKFALAEALAIEIPPRKRGPKAEENVTKYLEDARQAIIDGGGEEREISTLAQYRETALWVSFNVEGNVTFRRACLSPPIRNNSLLEVAVDVLQKLAV